ncbi:MAG: peptide chain release factor N(5)-glutamine methyltransferase [Candidatus Nomurabacteria bacterium]|jgi:release factor glutamine methyltransferase|nr:peptide chain release factor N(5)-glutamine methyltransferase [Candidatus Nomurabacteria bacterium]
MKIKDWLDQTTDTLRDAGIESARLDAELLLCDNSLLPSVYNDDIPESREEIITKLDDELSESTIDSLSRYVSRRAMHEPLAYVNRHKEFYGRSFHVDYDVLIPRPETETLIEIAKNLAPKKLLDVGTGSGCIAVTLDCELPEAEVTACDTSRKALIIALKNSFIIEGFNYGRPNSSLEDFSHALSLQRNHKKPANFCGINFVQSDLLDNIDGGFDLIVANLPYIDAKDPDWKMSEELKFEPRRALFAGTHGTALMRKLIRQAPKNLERNGHLLFEMDTRQLDMVSKYASQHDFKEIERQPFALLLQRV